jgi:heme/copper-type cytochrome/quinol oxidase subunit 3
MLLVGTVLACFAGLMLFAGMLGVWVSLRDAAGGSTATWLPKGVKVPGIPANMMLITMVAASIMVQWAVYAISRGDRSNTAVALGVTAVFGVAAINAQAYIYGQMKLGIGAGVYQNLFYTVTGTFLAAVLAGILFVIVTAFRTFGGRYGPKDAEGVAALATYWHFLTVAFAALWYVLYVVK